MWGARGARAAPPSLDLHRVEDSRREGDCQIARWLVRSSRSILAADPNRTVPRILEPMRRLPMLLALLLASPVLAQEYRVDAPAVVLNQVPFAITVTSSDVILDEANAGEFELVLNGVTHALAFERDDDDNRTLAASGLTTAGGGPYTVQVRRAGVTVAEAGGRWIAGWLSIVPPLIAIGIALIFKRVIPALFFGIWVGAWIAIGPTGAARGLFDAFQVFVMTTMLNADHVPIILFTLMIGGMVGIISKNGGMRGVVRHIVGWASTRQRGQVATWLMGLVIISILKNIWWNYGISDIIWQRF
jgi:hypothetical protein